MGTTLERLVLTATLIAGTLGFRGATSAQSALFARPLTQLRQDQPREQIPSPTKEETAEFRKRYAKQIAEKTPDSLAKMLDDAVKTNDDTVTRFLLLDFVSAQAAASYQLDLAFKAADEISRIYDVGLLGPRARILDPLNKAKKTPEQADLVLRVNFDTAIYAVDTALEKKNKSILDDAKPFAKFAEEGSKNSKTLQNKAKAISTYIEALNKSDAKEDDPAMQLARGKWAYFIKGDKDGGRALFANGTDSKLKEISARFAATPKTHQDWLKLSELLADAANERDRLAYEGNVLREDALDACRQVLATAQGTTRTKYETDAKFTRRMEDLERAATLALGTSVDLLALVEPGRDAVNNSKWKKTGTTLVAQPTGYGRIAVNYRPPEEYDYNVKFVRKQGAQDIVFVLPSGDKACSYHLCSGDGTTAAFYSAAGANGSTKKVIENDRLYNMAIKVRKDGSGYIAKAHLDGELLSEWKYTQKDLGMHSFWSMPNESCIGLGANNGTVEFKSAQLIEISGKGRKAK